MAQFADVFSSGEVPASENYTCELKRVNVARCPTAVRLGAQSDTVLEAVSIKQKFSETQRSKEWIYY